MLRLIMGRSGFGKTYRVMEDIAAWASAHKDAEGEAICCLLVPEQASFETERTLIRKLGERMAAKVQVLSFTRLCETLLKPQSVRPLSNGAKIMLMSRAVAECADSLELLGGTSRADTVAALLEAAAECHRSAVSAQALSAASEKLPEGTLRTKTAELALLLETYQALSANCASDPQESLLKLSEWLEASRALAGAHIFVDGFSGFTVPELHVLAALMGQADTVTVTLCTDRIEDPTQGMDRFSIVMETARKLIAAANECGCVVDKSTVLMTPHRFHNETLEVLEATAFTSDEWETAPSDAVMLTRCGDIYEESRYVAQTIRRLMRQDGRRARDVAIVAGNLNDYIGVLDAALEQADIPYYLDRRAPIVSEGVVTAVLAALRIACGKWNTESLLQLMKTGLLGFSVSSASMLENYVFVWNITGSQFKSEWKSHPKGFAAEWTDRDRSRLVHLNRLRRRLITPLLSLSKAIAKPLSGEEFAKAVYGYIEEARIDRMIARQMSRLNRCDEPALAQHTGQVWQALMDLLDDMATVLGNDKIDAAQATELLRAAASKTDIGSIPQALDAVQIGAADRIRFAQPSAVFVLGANEGVFPSLPSSHGLLTDRDRRALCEVGVPFEDNREHHTAMERFLAYTALSAATDTVFVSYLAVTPDGERGDMSSICQTVRSHLPFVDVRAALRDDGSDIETTAEAFERMADGFRAKTPLSRSLYALLWEDEKQRGRLQKMTQIAEDLPIAFENAAAAKRLFGDNMVLSPSKVEQYHQCRFSYFCRYGLRAMPRHAAELGAVEFGTLTHYVMESALPGYIEEGISSVTKERCFVDAKAISERYVEDEMGGFEDKPERFLYLFGRLQGVCGNFLWHAVRELSQSRFVPVDYELAISNDPKEEDTVPPMIVTLPDGAKISMIGKVDRVDMCEIAGQRYLRVIDYKTGSKQFRLEDVVEGINLQMLIYMMTLCQNGGERYGDVLPAGLLYMPSKAPMVTAEDGISATALEHKQMKKMRMNGLLLADEQVLRAMEVGLEGVFIPASFTKKGDFSSSSSVATLAQFGALGRRAERLMNEMAATLRKGDVDAQPFITAKNDPCAYCDYRAVCGHEQDDRVREPQFDSADDVLAALNETEGNGWKRSC